MTTAYPRRRSPRLQGYDYATAGAYFVTICTSNRLSLFGTIEDGELAVNDAGRMVADHWLHLPTHCAGVELDAFIFMPNHLHGILLLPDGGSLSLPAVIGAYKSRTTHDYTVGVKRAGWPPFSVKLWQRSFHDHVIRTDDSLDLIRRYIAANVVRWPSDPDNPRAL